MSRLENINLLISGILLGLIWIIQLVHYPSFEFIDAERFTAFHSQHTYGMGFIAAPLMLIELALSIYLATIEKKYVFPLIIVITIWISTFCIQVPLHTQLEKGMDAESINRLVNTNWIRTILWTGKAILLLTWLYKK